MAASSDFKQATKDTSNAKNAADSVVAVHGDINFLGLTVNQRLGSGVYVESQDASKCLVATSSYIAGRAGASIVTKDGKSIRASKITTDDKSGVAFLEIPGLPASDCHKLGLAKSTEEPGPKGDVKAIGAIPNGIFSQGMQIETAEGTADKQMLLPKNDYAEAQTVDVYDASVSAKTHDYFERPVQLKDFGGAPVIRDNEIVGLIRGGNARKIAAIPSATIAEALSDNHL